MRPGQQNKRGRGRSGNNNSNNNNNRKGQNPLSRVYDSSGPDVKVRGTAQHIAEKYMTLARDAQSSGDRVMAENYLQHAEHYNRIILAAQAQMQERFQKDEAAQSSEGADADEDGGDDAVEANSGRQENTERRDERRRERAPRPERQPDEGQQPQPTFEADAPQPVIDGVPAEVQMEQETPVGAQRPASRRRGRPRRARSEDDASAEGESKDAAVEVAGAAE